MAQRDIEDIYALSPAQRGMLFESISAPGSEIHVEQVSYRLSGRLDTAALYRSWQRLVERHAMLRTAFLWKDQEEPLQVVLRTVELPFEHQDWRGLPEGEQQRRLADYLESARRAGFVLSKPPLLKLALFQIADDTHRFVWTHHHILMDGASSPLLLRESLHFYRALIGGEADAIGGMDGNGALPPVRPFGDYIAWLERRDRLAEEAFWRSALSDLSRPTPLGREVDGAVAPEPGERYGAATLRLSSAETEPLRALGRQGRLTLSTFVQGAWALLLGRYSGDPDVVFGATVSGRPPDLPGIEATVGLFINTLPLRVRIAPERPLGAWLADLQASGQELLEHGQASVGELRRWCAVPPFLPLFESALVFENLHAEPATPALAETAIRIDAVESEGARTNYAVTLLATANPELSFKLVYDRNRLGPSAAEGMLAHLLVLLRTFGDGLDLPLGDVLAVVPSGEVPAIRALRRGARRRVEEPYLAPRTLLEEVVAGIWQQVLKISTVGVTDDFFELGGHSLIATEAVAMLREAFRIDLKLRHLFEAPTVAALAAEIVRLTGRSEEAGEAGRLPELVPDPEHRHEPFPLTEIQEAYWIGRGEAFELGNVSTHVYTEIEAEGLDLERFSAAWRALIERHEMLRTVFLPDGRQRILPSVPPYALRREDLRGLGEDERQACLLAVREEMSHQVLPSDRWPLFDLRVSRLAADRLRLHLSFDLLIGDGWSWGILFRDLAFLYQGEAGLLPVLELSFRDYVIAERRLEETDLFRRSRDYWLERLPALPPAPELPLQLAPGALARPRFVRRLDRLDPAAWGRLKERGARRALTPSTVVLAAFAEVLARWSKSPIFTVNLTLFHRLPLHPQVHDIVGDFTSLTLLAVDGSSAESFGGRANRIQSRLWDDLEHRYFGGVRVLRELARTAGRPARAAMPVVFTSTLNLTPPAQQAGGAAPSAALRLEPTYSIGQTPQVLLDHQAQERDGELVFNWDAVEDAFPEGVLDAMFEAFRALLRRLAEDEAAWEEPVRLALPEPQLARRARYDATEAEAPTGTLHARFESQARARPAEPAVIAAERTLTYGELERLSRSLALRLRREGVRPNQLVAVVTEKGWEEIVAVLAVVRAGAAYLPIAGALPEARVLHLLAHGGVTVALTQPRVAVRFAWPPGLLRLAVGTVETDAAETVDPGPLAPAPLAPTDLAYVIFTSGSTGQPKGVMIDHRGALNTLLDIERRFALGPADRVLALSSLSFDLSVFDVFGLLATGGAIVLPEAAAARDPARWLELMALHGVRVWNSVPALLEMLLDHAESLPGASLSPLRLCLLSGDWLPLRLPERVRRLGGEVEVVSLGGATEAAIWSIFFPICALDPAWASIPYGRPLANQRILVLDHHLAMRPEWVTGELYIAGLGLAQGYWRDPERTAAAFLTHPETGERLYRTGDLGRFLPAGFVELLGREDLQVKIRGHRIELGEIEAALEQHPAVRSAVVTAAGEERDRRQLVAYVVRAGTDGGGPGDEPAGGGEAGARMAYLDFKLSEAGLRRDEGERPGFAFAAPGDDPEDLRPFAERRSVREFADDPVPVEQLGRLLGALRQVRLDGGPLPKYRYPSAGSLYPVQVYVYVKPGRMSGLPAGGYYYHPREHRLVHLSTGALGREVHGLPNQPIFDGSAFSLFLIAALDAIRPVYGEWARDFCLLEAGAISQLLMTVAPEHGLGLCPIGNLDAAPLRALFDLADEHLLLHSLEGGPPAAAEPGKGVRPASPFAEALRRHLSDRLPAYMVPGSFVFLDALPLSANGKVDRRSLPAADPGEALHPEAYTPPAGPVEERLAAIWSEVLELERVGRHDSFLDLGGDSVQGVRMLARARESGIELNIRELFEQQTIAGLAGVARTSAGAAGESTAGRWDAALDLDRSEIEDILEEFDDGETDDEGV